MRNEARLLWPFALLICAACSGAEGDLGGRGEGDPAGSDALRVRRGDLAVRHLLTGSLEAVESVPISAPDVPGGQLQIRWIAEDGARVRKGDKLLELDNTAFVSDLEDKRLSARKSTKELEELRARHRGEDEEKAFAVEERRAELEKARLEAEVPESLLPRQEYEERRLALHRAKAAFEKARDDLELHRRVSEEEVSILELSLRRTLDEIGKAEEAIRALVLEAPSDGIVVVGEQPWERRKFQPGDVAWPGLVLARIPDLSEMRVVALLSDVDDGRVLPGMPASVTLDAFPDRKLEGTVAAILPVAQETGPFTLRRAFRVSVTLRETDPARMRPGMSARVEVTREVVTDALLAPRAALDLAARPPVALLRGGDEREVRVGSCDALECVVLEGLSNADWLRRRSER